MKPNGHSVFSSVIQNFESCTLANIRIFYSEIQISKKRTETVIVLFTTKRNFWKYDLEISCFVFSHLKKEVLIFKVLIFFTIKSKIRNINGFWIENLSPHSTTAIPNQFFIGEKTVVKKSSLIKCRYKKSFEISSYKIELRYRFTQNDVILWVTNWKVFMEIFVLRY